MRTTLRALAALLTVVTLTAACGSDGGTSDDTTGPTPGGSSLADLDPDTVVASHDVGGGFVPPGFDEVSLPTLTVYADGRAVASDPEGPGATILQLEAAELDELVAELRDRLDGAPAVVEPSGPPSIADAATTELGVADDEGRLHTTSAYALDFLSDNYPTDLLTANATLLDVVDHVRSAGEPYEGDGILVVAVASYDEDPAAVPWPEGIDVPEGVAELAAEPDRGAGVVVGRLAGSDAATVRAAITSDSAFTTVALPDGAAVSMGWRPLLPHE